MSRKLDFKSDNTFDLIIQDGDFVIDNNKDVQGAVIIHASKGDIRQYPLLGAELTKFLGTNINENIFNNYIESQLIQDGFSIIDFVGILENKEYTGNITIE